MRRALLALVVASIAIAGAPGRASADAPQPDPDIAGLQTALAVKGFYHGRIDGFRGPLTAAAVRALQRRMRLAATSIVTNRTLSALGPLGRPGFGSRPLRRGMVGRDVAALQFELRYHGFANRGRGIFGTQTELALKRFQRFAGLPSDGVAGRATFAALRQPPPSVARLRLPLPDVQSVTRAGRAVELACPYATAVAAAAAGTVVFAGTRGRGYGYTVVTRGRTGVEIVYAHLARFDVEQGRQLAAGALVGLAGWTGKTKAVTTLRVELFLRGAQLDAYAALYGR
ncbi:MAG: peptidoglycan-binding protein [Gaiellaceae bacterium]|jgi:hypothetical protein